jgi:hypothetical protein
MESIEELLRLGWPDQADVLGAATISRIASGVESGLSESEMFRGEEGGGELTFHEIVLDMIAAASVVKATIEIIQTISTEGTRPTAKQVKERLVKTHLKFADELVKKVISLLQSLNKIA